MSLFIQAEAQVYTNWRRVTMAGFQVGSKFLNESGKYRYGVFELSGHSSAEIELELVQKTSGSLINFAIVNASEADWKPTNVSAFRHDLDFYVFTGIDDLKLKALREYIEASGVPVLCMTTPLEN